jgi:hypothetical protein
MTLRARSVAPVLKPAPAKLPIFQNLAISKLEGMAIPVSKSGTLFGCLAEFQNLRGFGLLMPCPNAVLTCELVTVRDRNTAVLTVCLHENAVFYAKL